jgi:hypothetical protein
MLTTRMPRAVTRGIGMVVGVTALAGLAVLPAQAATTPQDTVYCFYTTDTPTPVHGVRGSGDVLYTVPKGDTVTATRSITDGYRYGWWGSHTAGYIWANNVYNQGACFE